MDTLIAGSTLLAYLASLVETLRGGPHVWYDAAVMFVFLLLVARMLEQRARGIASAQVDALARARPALATREDDDGRRESIPLHALAVGDIACVAAGEILPADGALLDAPARFEEALLTGESQPLDKAVGARVLAGTICRDRPVRLRVTAVGSGTCLPSAGPACGSRRRTFRHRTTVASRGHLVRLARGAARARLRGDAGIAGDQLPVRVVAVGARGLGCHARRTGAHRRARRAT
jgi:magnesium-transporting ATPase (P-type)